MSMVLAYFCLLGNVMNKLKALYFLVQEGLHKIEIQACDVSGGHA